MQPAARDARPAAADATHSIPPGFSCPGSTGCGVRSAAGIPRCQTIVLRLPGSPAPAPSTTHGFGAVQGLPPSLPISITHASIRLAGRRDEQRGADGKRLAAAFGWPRHAGGCDAPQVPHSSPWSLIRCVKWAVAWVSPRQGPWTASSLTPVKGRAAPSSPIAGRRREAPLACQTGASMPCCLNACPQHRMQS